MAEKNFVDYVKIFCASGNGGAGSAHMRREKFVAYGGPDGGDGGRGGHVIIRGNAQLWTLLHLKFQKHIRAGHGEPGGKSGSSGAFGQDIIIEVPLGTIARDSETNEILFEITNDGETEIIVQGGRGGLGNLHFKSSTNQTPRYAQPGEEGIEGWFILEMKSIGRCWAGRFSQFRKINPLVGGFGGKTQNSRIPFYNACPQLRNCWPSRKPIVYYG